MKINKVSPINFNAGLSKKINAQIKSCDTKKIAQEFAKHNVYTDFKNNKTIAWCSLVCLKLFDILKFTPPNGIIVEDFNNLKIQEPWNPAFTNIAPTNIYKNNDIIVPDRTIFFNSNKDIFNFWEELDTVADIQYQNKNTPTDFFMETFFHEFGHVAHETNLIKKLGGEQFLKLFMFCLNEDFEESFKIKYGQQLNNICNYASTSPFEAVACDFSKRLSENIDKNSLLISPKALSKSPYRDFTILEKIFGIKKESELDKILRSFWSGNFK